MVLTNIPVEGAAFHAGSSNLPSILMGLSVLRTKYRLSVGGPLTWTGTVAARTRSSSFGPDLMAMRS